MTHSVTLEARLPSFLELISLEHLDELKGNVLTIATGKITDRNNSSGELFGDR